jgi:hypothetical protein
MKTHPDPESSKSSPIFDPFSSPQLYPVNWDLSEMVNQSSNQVLLGDPSIDKTGFEVYEFSHDD